jgi:hypothetical protein
LEEEQKSTGFLVGAGEGKTFGKHRVRFWTRDQGNAILVTRYDCLPGWTMSLPRREPLAVNLLLGRKIREDNQYTLLPCGTAGAIVF